MKKTLSVICLCTIILSAFCFNAGATEFKENSKISNSLIGIINEDEPLILRAAYTRSYASALSISSGTTTSKSTFLGYSGTTTKVTIKQVLQKLSGGSWSKVTAWTKTFNSYSATYTNKQSVAKGTYRVKSVFTAYSGSSSEQITDFSPNVTY